VLREHPRIADAAVIGRPDARWGESGLAFVEMRAHERLDEQELAAFCRSRIARYKIPARFVVVQEFPRTAAGKIKKHQLDAGGEAEIAEADPRPRVGDPVTI